MRGGKGRNVNAPPRRRIAVLGAGITGLAAAHRLHELLPEAEVTVFDAAPRPGGVLRTDRRDGWLLERSADNFITNVPWGVELCRRLGLEGELIETDPRLRRALVVHRGQVVPVPDGFSLMTPARLWPILTTPILSWRGKLRLAGEYFVPRRRDERDESLESFAVRRLGREAFERLVQPLVAGIYTADAARLSVAAALPRFVEMEQIHGGLIRAARRRSTTGRATDDQAAGARYSLFVAPRDGMQRLVDALVERLPATALRMGTEVKRVARTPQGAWQLALGGGGEPPTVDGVIVALPAPAAARALADADRPLAELLGEIPYAGSAVALAGYRTDQFAWLPQGFGFVVPEIERRRLLAASFASHKFPGRAPAGHVLVRLFFGGAMHPEMDELDEAELQRIAAEELGALCGLKGEPQFFEVQRWRGAMPQYHLGHLERLRRIEARVGELPGLRLAGNAYHGVGVPQCIDSGQRAAEELARHLEAQGAQPAAGPA